MKIDGACHCGEIRYEADVDPANTIICHCTDCQTMSGAPYRVNVAAPARTLRLTGSPTIYKKRGDDGEEVTTTFCGTCGTAICSGKGATPKFVWLRTGAIRQRAELPPQMQGFCQSAMPWAMDITLIRQVPPARKT